MRPTLRALWFPLLAWTGLASGSPQDPGYTDTPRLPDGFRVHDAQRPRPPIVAPARLPEGAGAAPADAVRLFDGKGLDAFVGRDGPAKWQVRDGAMEVNGTGDIETAAEFGDCQLHIEWATPTPPKGDSQARGNSGVFFCGRYEIQILDSFENATYADGQAAALYGQAPPAVNASLPPGAWQSYDIVFVAPRFGADGSLTAPARATVFHNGVLVHHDRPFLGETAHRAVARYRAHAPKGRIRLQDHGDPVRFRNVWVRPLEFEEPKAAK